MHLGWVKAKTPIHQHAFCDFIHAVMLLCCGNGRNIVTVPEGSGQVWVRFFNPSESVTMFDA